MTYDYVPDFPDEAEYNPVTRCVECGDEIYPGMYYYDVDGDAWCEQCMYNHKMEAEAPESGKKL